MRVRVPALGQAPSRGRVGKGKPELACCEAALPASQSTSSASARVLFRQINRRELPRLQRMGKVFAYASGVVARPVGWAVLAGTAQVVAEDQLRIGPRHNDGASGADTTASQAVTGGIAGALVALVRDSSKAAPAVLFRMTSPTATVVWYAALGAVGGLFLPVVRYMLSHKGGNLLEAGGKGLDMGIGSGRGGDGADGAHDAEEGSDGSAAGGAPARRGGRGEDAAPSVADIEALMSAAEEAERRRAGGAGRR